MALLGTAAGATLLLALLVARLLLLYLVVSLEPTQILLRLLEAICQTVALASLLWTAHTCQRAKFSEQWALLLPTTEAQMCIVDHPTLPPLTVLLADPMLRTPWEYHMALVTGTTTNTHRTLIATTGHNRQLFAITRHDETHALRTLLTTHSRARAFHKTFKLSLDPPCYLIRSPRLFLCL